MNAFRCLLLLVVACCALHSLSSAASAAPTAPPLTVHLVCHSHDDVGWQITVDEYYDREVRNILNTVVASLALNSSRRFMYVEQAFFQRWWREQGADQRALAQKLVKAKQLEFVNGGWCMHDEASTHYVDMVDQTTLGHQYITQQFGVQPTVTWQIDPFGHSATQAVLFGPLSGMDAVFTARIDYQDRAKRLANKDLEMVWSASASLGDKTFAGAFAPGYGYGPPAGFCWDRGCRNTPIQNNKSAPGMRPHASAAPRPVAVSRPVHGLTRCVLCCAGYNLDTFVNNFVATAQKQATMTQGVNLMVTLPHPHHTQRGRASQALENSSHASPFLLFAD
jgi:alpha-mannosidase